MATTRSAQVQVRMQPELKAMGQKAAAAEARTLSSLIVYLLSNYLMEHGYLDAEGKPVKRKR